MFRNTLICLNTFRQKTIKREKAKIEDKEKITLQQNLLGQEGNIITGMDRGLPQFQATRSQLNLA